MSAMDVVILLLALVAAALAAFAAVAALRAMRAAADASSQTQLALTAIDQAGEAISAVNAALLDARSTVGQISRQQAVDTAVVRERLESVSAQVAQVGERADGLRREVTAGQDKTRETVERQLGAIREDNARQLDRMRETVDEKLSRTLNDRLSSSFKQVTDQLDTVSRGLGEMREVASGVGDLKRVLSNVKTRGILGEVQLGAILREILTPDQYLEDVATVPESRERVEFAVKIPVDGGEPLLLPIDSKFPGDAYEHLRLALDEGDAAAVTAARKILERQIKLEAKDISEKYLTVPATTNFGIMFLPFEGLYAEVVNIPGLVESLQRDFRVNVAGPSTMAAILNSLQMSYQTFAFQKRADEIQQVLAAVKAEFPNYQSELRRALKQIRTAEKTVDGIINTRTNVIERKLRSVTALDDEQEVARLLGAGAAAVDVDAAVEASEEDGD